MNCSSLWLVAHLWSIHSHGYQGGAYNNGNYGVGLECDTSSYMIQAGAYYNSMRTHTEYLGVGKVWGTHWQAGVFGGAATGYHIKPLEPIAGALVGYQWTSVRVQVLVLPPVDHEPLVGHLTVAWRFR